METNLIYDEDNVIGKTKDIINRFYKLIKYDIDKIDDFLEKNASIKEKFEFIDMLTNDVDNNEICLDTVLKVSYNPMGAYYYTVV